ncbi:GNAT family N-acetyltransferase [Acinetobacter sp.]|uniref:GNAT family N-acetyltransferase n=1 Tax=Acinetobacter sp. TaxID=472 RepID=UPI0035B36522
MKIRPETAQDYPAIEKLIYAAFLNHPHHAPDALPTEHLIVARLRQNNAMSLALVAEDQNQIAGHIAFSPISINGQPSQWYGLGPVSVLPSMQNQGIGSQLIHAGLKILTARKAAGAVLLGEPEYYQRFGFQAHPHLTLPGVPAEYFLIKPLTDDAEIPQGTAAYDAAFAG